jgi:murein DD-endopeptidase MepM/ murein hydrolase activator NlpD
MTAQYDADVIRIVVMHSVRVQRFMRRAIACVVGAMAAMVPMIAGPIGAGDLSISYVPASASKAYAYSLITSLEPQDPAARRWIEAGQSALADAVEIGVPHSAKLVAEPDVPTAVAYRVHVRTGRSLKVSVAAPDAADDVFVELFERHAEGYALEWSNPVSPGSPGKTELVWRGLRDSDLLLRVQPSLEYQGTLEIELAESPLLQFPVTGHSTQSIHSGFGAERDGGRRAHRGVDIFADRGTEVVASLDAWVTRVDTTTRGGNIVWLQPLFGNLRLYYAHLDTQLVEEGDLVRAGDVLGTVGNTGNAVTTPPHLHYGVYLRRAGVRRGGARDPIDFLR